MKTITILILLVLIGFYTGLARTYTVSGYVTDEESGETLIGVNIVIKDRLTGASSDGNGFFRISGLSPGEYVLQILHIGYRTKEINLTVVNQSIVLDDIDLQPVILEHEEIVVTGSKEDVIDIGVQKIG